MILNKTDKRTQQYRSKLPPILEVVAKGELPPVFESFLPDTPRLATATDETLGFHTLKERFDTYYDNVRKVARELEDRCEGRIPAAPAKPTGRFAQRIRGILQQFARAN